jgi:hypothetical protein
MDEDKEVESNVLLAERDELAKRYEILKVAMMKISRITSPSPGIKPSKNEARIGSIAWNAQCDLGQF